MDTTVFLIYLPLPFFTLATFFPLPLFPLLLLTAFLIPICQTSLLS
ncbi:hypothetical protein RAC92_06795 [Agrobacterium sp. CR_3]|nr:MULTISPECIES: hypothetical protein [Agrobacterium]MDA5246229.1 hypothetical protein [Agrobacterium sp. MAFF210268]